MYSFKTFSISEQTETACLSYSFYGTTYSVSGACTHSLVNGNSSKLDVTEIQNGI